MMTPAHIRIDGNKAVATCHSQLVIKDPREPDGIQGPPHHREPLGTDQDGRRVEGRTAYQRPPRRRPEARALLAAGVTA